MLNQIFSHTSSLSRFQLKFNTPTSNPESDANPNLDQLHTHQCFPAEATPVRVVKSLIVHRDWHVKYLANLTWLRTGINTLLAYIRLDSKIVSDSDYSKFKDTCSTTFVWPCDRHLREPSNTERLQRPREFKNKSRHSIMWVFESRDTILFQPFWTYSRNQWISG